MASLDNLQLLTELLENDKFDYIVIGLQRGRKNYKADVFLGISKENLAEFNEVLEQIHATMNHPDFRFQHLKKKRKRGGK